jgi:pimeloyl-ACP methyl ester carboxylesterase
MKKAIALGFIVIIVLLVGSYYMFPEVILRLAINAERNAAGLTKKEIQVDDHKIVYLEGGKGQTVLLLHGFGAYKDDWTRFAKYLTKDYHVVIPDLPGFGESSQIPQDVYDTDSQLKRIDRFMETLKLDKFHIAGNSMGGMFAAAYSATYPQKVLTAALLDSGGVKSPHKSEAYKLFEKGINPLLVSNGEEFDRLLKLVFVNPPFIPGEFKKIFAAQLISRRDFNKKIWVDLKWNEIKDGTPVAEIILNPYLPMIQAPVLVIWGDSDKFLDVGCTAVLEKNLKKHQTVIMKDTGHVPMLERPQDTATVYLTFLKNQQ